MQSFEYGIVLVLVFIKAWATLCEVAISESRRSRLEREAAGGIGSAAFFLHHLESLTRLGPTFHLTGALMLLCIGMFCCRSVCLDAGAVGIIEGSAISVVLVLVGLFMGDLVPRVVARRFPEEVGRVVAPSARSFGRILRIFFLPAFSLVDLVLSPVGGAGAEGYEVSEEDVKSIVAEAKRSGNVEEGERQIIHRVFRLGDKQAATIMTPRSQVAALTEKCAFQESVAHAIASHRTWLPVVAEDGDEVFGVISARDLLDLERGHPTGETLEIVRSRLVNPIRAPETAPLLSLIDSMRKDRIHFAVIVDEYGVFVGVVTLHDVVEALIGEVGELDDTTPEIARRADGSLIVDARVAMGDLWDELAIPEESPYTDSEFHSLGGFIMSYLGHVPRDGEAFAAHGYVFEVVHMDRHRIDKVAIKREVEAPEDTELSS